MSLTLELSKDFGYVLLAAVIMGFEVIAFGMFPSGQRKRLFTQKYLTDNFGAAHKQATNTEIKPNGYPDMGDGRYSQKLNYKEWLEFNSAQRAHLNFVEGIATSLILLIVAGIYFPCYAAPLGAVIIVGRALYAIGYSNKGPSGRMIGILLVDLALIGLMVFSIWSCVNIVRGIAVTPCSHQH